MKIIYSDQHRVHHGSFESNAGKLELCYERPERADFVLAAVGAWGIGPVVPPERFPMAPIERVHAPRYLRFLERAWEAWSALGNARDALPDVWPIRGFRHDIEPDDFLGQLGLYSFDTGTPLTAGTWTAARLSAETALTAQRAIAAGEAAAFALTRPPGHHAGSDFFGGYCFINNAAVAAQALIDGGARRVAILDVDYHHGNGTQSIFYDRADVLVLSIHADPRTEYPYYLGHADETGSGAGTGYNHNYPLSHGASSAVWFEALDAACDRVRACGVDTLVVSLGVDTYVGDPLSTFQLEAPDYLTLGNRLAAVRRPTLFVLEGGYGGAEMGSNVAAVLRGFEDA
jgi:acetoin utilization deacetylase AcuC-like enzyme